MSASKNQAVPEQHILPRGRLVLVAQTASQVRDLPGFDRRYHRIPTAVTEASSGFVSAIGATARSELLAQVRGRLRQCFGYRRRQLKLGESHIATPDFEYYLEHQLDPEDPSQVFLRAELSEFRGPELLSAPAFVAAMCGPGPGCHRFDRVRIEHRVTCDIEACIDALEDQGICLEYPDDCAYMCMNVPDPPCELEVWPLGVELRGILGESPGVLLEQLMTVVSELALAGVDVLPRTSQTNT
ncbi:MAG: hypothetical protein ACPG77_02495 [Nannocystaceae bacterium]